MSALNFLQLQQRVARRLRMDLNDDNQATLVKEFLTDSEEEINSLTDWPWLYDRKIIQTSTEKTAGTVSVSAGATAVVGVGTAFAATDVGSFIQFSTSDDWYKIDSVSDANNLEIEIGYTGTTALSAGTYTIRKVFYSLGSGIDTVLTIRQAITPVKLTIKHYKEMDASYPDITDTGNPHTATIWGPDSNRYWQISLFPIPDAKINLEIRYKKETTDMSADKDLPTISPRWKTVLLAGALWRGYNYNNDQRATQWFQIYQFGRDKMLEKPFPESDQHPIIESREGVMVRDYLKFPDEITEAD